MRRPIAATALLLGLAALSACSSGGAGADCIDATDTGAAIAEGANDTPITPVDAKAVQSETSEVYYVAVTFTIPADDEESTGIWATDDLDGGTILSVDALAKEFTDWPDAEAAFGITYPNDGTDAAEACVSG